MEKLAIIPVDQLLITIKETVNETVTTAVKDMERRKNGEKTFFINQVAKRLGKSHTTIKKLCASGIIRTTKDGQITESAIEEYLQNQ